MSFDQDHTRASNRQIGCIHQRLQVNLSNIKPWIIVTIFQNFWLILKNLVYTTNKSKFSLCNIFTIISVPIKVNVVLDDGLVLKDTNLYQF